MQKNNKIFIFMAGVMMLLLMTILFIKQSEKQNLNTKIKKITKLEKNNNDSIVKNPKTRANKKIIKRPRHKSLKIKKLKKERRKQMLKRIKEKLYLAEKESQEKMNNKDKNRSASISPDGNSNENPKPQLDKDYIKEQVGEIIPFIKECYNDSLEENPDLSGKVVVSFTIIGDPDVGGMIETSEFLENSMKGSENFNNCILDSLYEMELEAPENNGKMKVSYPFVFNNKKK